MKRRAKTTIEVCCTVPECTTKVRVAFTSPAAPMLSALETLAESGWSYQIGFFTMLTGQHYQRCPKHR